jgi:hypothetical protein
MLWQIGLGWSLRNIGLLPFGMHARIITHLVLLKPKHLLILFSQAIHVHGKCKTFGSLDVQCFVLNKKLQDGDSIAKWKSRSWIGVYVGHSLAHAGNVPVIYNPYTTHVSPQFHVVFDDQFTTVSTDPSVLNENFYTTLYDKALWNYNDTYAEVDDLYYFDKLWQNEGPPRNHLRIRGSKRKHSSNNIGEQATYNGKHANGKYANPNSEQANQTCKHASNNAIAPHIGEHAIGKHAISNPPTLNTSSERTLSSPVPDPLPNDSNLQPDELLHGVAKPNLEEIMCSSAFQAYKETYGIHAHIYTATMASDASTIQPVASSASSPESIPCEDFVSLLSYSNPNSAPDPAVLSVNMACNNKDDILTQSQMFKASNAEQFIKCQKDEIAGLTKFDVMDIHHIMDLPPHTKLLSSIWSYRRICLPNGVLLKYKARLCVNGKEQEFGRDYWKTYAPVASWSTIRLLMLLSSIMNLKTRQVDYTQVFPVYMKIPQGWYVNSDGYLVQHENPKYNDTQHYLKLKCNLYGCKQAAQNWYKHLSEGLLAEGFRQSSIDCCLFLRNDCILLVYVDDCLIFSPTNDTIDTLIQSLSKKFLLQDEGNVSAFLGVQVATDSTTKTITLSQPGLIEQVIHDIGLDQYSKGKDTPADTILHVDSDGALRQQKWNYCSVIGKLNYIANSTRPDISMAMHHCARFSSNPKALHELAVKRIIRYLYGTKDKGYFFSSQQ